MPSSAWTSEGRHLKQTNKKQTITPPWYVKKHPQHNENTYFLLGYCGFRSATILGFGEQKSGGCLLGLGEGIY